ncbi:hypothetical protein BJV74DRAFT_797917 [Russula compacta]|nr:hypothetical protein BJV74DRAFT_797917 [Russula compacta]
MRDPNLVTIDDFELLFGGAALVLSERRPDSALLVQAVPVARGRRDRSQDSVQSCLKLHAPKAVAVWLPGVFPLVMEMEKGATQGTTNPSLLITYAPLPIYPTRLSTITVRFPATMPWMVLASFWVAEKDCWKEKGLAPASAREDGVSVSSAKCPPLRDPQDD